MAIRVILADDHPLTREGLRSYLEHESDIQLVGEAADGIAAWDLIERELPDVALLDIRMPGEDGISLARKVRERKLPIAVLMLTTYDAQQYVLAALRAGAKGYVLKTATPDDLIQAIRTVASGGVYLDREVSSSVKAVDFMPESLSPREQEVLLLAGRGLSSKEVASQLIISERTVQTHLASIYDKLGARKDRKSVV